MLGTATVREREPSCFDSDCWEPMPPQAMRETIAREPIAIDLRIGITFRLELNKKEGKSNYAGVPWLQVGAGPRSEGIARTPQCVYGGRARQGGRAKKDERWRGRARWVRLRREGHERYRGGGMGMAR